MKNLIKTLLVIAFISPMGEASITNAQCWTQKGIDIDGEAGDDRSGESVSLSSDGNTVAISAMHNDGNGDQAGHVRIFEWNGIAWTQKGMDIDGETAGDNSGRSVSLSSDGNTVAIGAWQNDGNGDQAGHVRIYEWSGSAWIQKGIDIDGEAVGDNSGYIVSLSSHGNTVAISAVYNDGNGQGAGHVRIYEWNGTTWIQKGIDIDGEAADDISGLSLSLSSDGNTVAIGAVSNDGNGENAGHVRIYEWSGFTWIQKGTDIDGEEAMDRSGWSVSLSSDGNTVAIGARYNDGNGPDAGHVRIYEWNGSAWIQKGTDIDGKAEDDQSGESVSLSSDGNTVAIGAINNDGNGEDAGHVRIYEWIGTVWIQKGIDIDGEAEQDRSGRKVPLSSDGNIVAISAEGSDGNGENAGHVRIYEWTAITIDLGNDTTICSSQALTLDATIPNANYLWSNGSIDPTLVVDSSGVYGITVNINGCTVSDEIEITALSQPVAYLGDDTTLCDGNAILLDVYQADVNEYLWQDGSTSPILEITDPGFYAVTLSNECGTDWDSVEVNFYSAPIFLDLGSDQVLCLGDSIILDAITENGLEYEWNNGTQSSICVIGEGGDYQVTIKNECTEVSDQISIISKNCCDFYIPNAFSPNYDGVNDEFKIYNSSESCNNITSFSLKIFNRWGELVFESNDINANWDGQFRNQNTTEGVFAWVLAYHDGLEYHIQNGDVSILR